MIYIISEKTDLVTDLVIEWLLEKKKQFKRFHVEEFIQSKTRISDGTDQLAEFANAQKVWQRRGAVEVLPKEVLSHYPNRNAYVDYLVKDAKILNTYQEFQLKQSLKDNYIGSLKKEINNNKLINLSLAKEVGLRVPNTLVTTSKTELVAFHKKYQPIITKDLRAPVLIKTRFKTRVSKGVELVTEEALASLADVFAPIYLQQYLEKVYEIRAFIVCGKIFSMAIFSQKDQKTQVDYRNYNKVKPNRCVPVKLPEAIEQKVWRFMEAAELNTGSIDIIYTPAGEYYFLEVNPMGQFHWVSQNCNYHIEKSIADFLSADSPN